MSWYYIIYITVLVEGLISYTKMVIGLKKIHYEVVLSAAIGIVISLIYEIDLFKILSIETRVPYIGSILTGILISRGSNYVYDLLKKVVGIQSGTVQYERPKTEINEDTVEHEV